MLCVAELDAVFDRLAVPPWLGEHDTLPVVVSDDVPLVVLSCDSDFVWDELVSCVWVCDTVFVEVVVTLGVEDILGVADGLGEPDFVGLLLDVAICDALREMD